MNIESKNPRRKNRMKQLRINNKIKKRLWGDKVFALCRYCRFGFLVSDLTVEHIIPLSFGGSDEDDNVDLACKPCNHTRGRDSWLLKRKLDKERRVTNE